MQIWEGGGYRRAEIAIPRVTASPISRRSPESASCSVSQWIEISQFNAMPSLVRGRCPPPRTSENKMPFCFDYLTAGGRST